MENEEGLVKQTHIKGAVMVYLIKALCERVLVENRMTYLRDILKGHY